MDKYALVTGGGGFVGRVLTNRLIKEGYHVTIVDDLSNTRYENINKNSEFYKLDISDSISFDILPNYPYEIVFHIAAQSSNAISWKFPEKDLLVNQLGTYNILDFCIKHNIKRFVFTSSMSAYGVPGIYPTPESIDMKPDTFYAVHKLASEHYLRIFAKEHDMNYTIFRLYTTYGHGQNLDNVNQGLLSIYLSYIINNKPLIVKGSKDRTRDIIHVSDVLDAMILSLTNDKSYNKTYNMGTGIKITIENIIELLITGMGFNIKEYPVKYQDGTQGDPFDTLADISLIGQDLGWKPKISPREGIQLTIDAYKFKE